MNPVSRWVASLVRGNGAGTPRDASASEGSDAGAPAHHKPATFDDYKRRLNGGVDLWQLYGEWWHVSHVREPRPLPARVFHPPVQVADLAGGNCIRSEW